MERAAPTIDDPAGPRAGLRDTNAFYAEGDPMRWVDHSIVERIRSVCGDRLLDLGCGVGGYAKALGDAGFAVQALDINPRYVEIARRLGVDARQYDGLHLPLDDRSVDTVYLVEVLEHVPDPAALLAEVRRVARRNVVVTVPNNTQRLNPMVTWSHMLDVDHKHFFTAASLEALLSIDFHDVRIEQVFSIDHLLAKDLLSKWLHRLYRTAVRLRLEQEKLFFRLIAVARC